MKARPHSSTGSDPVAGPGQAHCVTAGYASSRLLRRSEAPAVHVASHQISTWKFYCRAPRSCASCASCPAEPARQWGIRQESEPRLRPPETESMDGSRERTRGLGHRRCGRATPRAVRLGKLRSKSPPAAADRGPSTEAEPAHASRGHASPRYMDPATPVRKLGAAAGHGTAQLRGDNRDRRAARPPHSTADAITCSASCCRWRRRRQRRRRRRRRQRRRGARGRLTRRMLARRGRGRWVCRWHT
jgi:hypothetical protein